MNPKVFQIMVHPTRKVGVLFWVCPKCDNVYAPVDWPTDVHIRAWDLHVQDCPVEKGYIDDPIRSVE